MEVIIVLIVAAAIVYITMVFEKKSAVTITDTQSYILKTQYAASVQATTKKADCVKEDANPKEEESEYETDYFKEISDELSRESDLMYDEYNPYRYRV